MKLHEIVQIKYSDSQLLVIAKQVGEKLFGSSHSGLILGNDVVRCTYEDFVSEYVGDDGTEIGTYQYSFLPSSKKGFDTSEKQLDDTPKDTDGNWYLAGESGVFVIGPDQKNVKSEVAQDVPANNLEDWKKEMIKRHGPNIQFRKQIGNEWRGVISGRAYGSFVELKDGKRHPDYSVDY